MKRHPLLLTFRPLELASLVTTAAAMASIAGALAAKFNVHFFNF